MNPAALRQFLDCLSRSVAHYQAGDRLAAEGARLGASAAAFLAFPVGSRESRALGVLLHAAGTVTPEEVPS
jgi:hypothetical protein